MSRRLGLIVRSDFGGGLANQTYELWRNLEPDATLVVLYGARGRHEHDTVEEPDRYPGAHVVTYSGADNAIMADFLSRIDVLVAVETFAVPYLVIRAHELGIERVLYANPELLVRDDPAEVADRYLYAGAWEHPYPAPGEILPWPCSTDAVRPREAINWPPRLVHVGAPAMLDRNGTDIVLAAAPRITRPCTIDVYGRPHPQSWQAASLAEVRYPDRLAPLEHWNLYLGYDLLVLPRRYGCLSLPMLEAAACGVPTLTTDLLPQSLWLERWAPWLLHPAGRTKLAPMKAGFVAVAEPEPHVVAQAIDRLVERDDFLDSLRVETRAWAEARSWDACRNDWHQALRAER